MLLLRTAEDRLPDPRLPTSGSVAFPSTYLFRKCRVSWAGDVQRKCQFPYRPRNWSHRHCCLWDPAVNCHSLVDVLYTPGRWNTQGKEELREGLLDILRNLHRPVLDSLHRKDRHLSVCLEPCPGHFDGNLAQRLLPSGHPKLLGHYGRQKLTVLSVICS